MTVNKFLLPILSIVALLGSVLVAQAAGEWNVSGKSMLDVENLTSADDIRGWMTLKNISTGFSIPQDTLYGLLNLPSDFPPETALKDMEGLFPGFEVTTVREAVEAYLDGAVPVQEEPAGEIQPAAVEATPAPTEHVPQGPGTGSGSGEEDGSGAGPTPLPPGTLLAGSEIKGRHTLAEIGEQCQVDLSELLVALALPENIDLDTKAKDLIGQGTVTDLQVLRDAVTGLQEK